MNHKLLIFFQIHFCLFVIMVILHQASVNILHNKLVFILVTPVCVVNVCTRIQGNSIAL